MSGQINRLRRRERIGGVIGLLLIGVISFVADLSANDQLRTAPRRVVRAVTTAALACLGSGRHDRATRPRSA